MNWNNYKTNEQFPSSTIKTPPCSLRQPELKWETLHYSNPTHPNVWGPSFWFTLHNGAINYPQNPSVMYKERMKSYIKGMQVMIPCEICADHATAHIEANWSKMDDIVSSRDKVFDFFVDFHNYVNKRYSKPIMSYQEARKLYSGRISVSKMSYKDECIMK